MEENTDIKPKENNLRRGSEQNRHIKKYFE